MSLRMNEAPSPSPGVGTGHKTRRPHKKSRHGCSKCKDRRIKCDERMPRCSRCSKMDLICRYPKRPPGVVLVGSGDSGTDSAEPIDSPMDPPHLQLVVPRTRYGPGSLSPDSSRHSSAIPGSPSPLSSVPTSIAVPPSPSPLGQPGHDRRPGSPLKSRALASQTLTSTEFELLQHYLEHTSVDLTVDDEDQYTLQVGIPNLACESKPLMRSLLALSAVCKCHDIIAQPSVSRDDRSQVLELVSLAQHYHMKSLREIQATLHEDKHYAHVLGNAALMGMYGSGSYCARIWLAKTATPADQPLGDFAPKHSEWISLFRAARLAYVGLLNDTGSDDTGGQPSPARSPVDPIQLQYEYTVSPRVSPLRTPPTHALYPILATTINPALPKLHSKAAHLTGNPDPPAQACLAALSILTTIISETFPSPTPSRHSPSQPGPPGHAHAHLNPNLNPNPNTALSISVDILPSSSAHTHPNANTNPNATNRLAHLPPWLRRYTARITSVLPSPLPRRTIMSFVHKVPSEYLALVDDMMALVQDDTVTVTTTAPTPGINDVEGGMSVAHQLTVDIFAHWLVLVVLLEDVWWIGGIGAWELGRVVQLRRVMMAGWGLKRSTWWDEDEGQGQSQGQGEAWWPESMCEVWRLVEGHRG